MPRAGAAGVGVSLLLWSFAANAAPAPPSTFLASGGVDTGRYAEVEKWCRDWPRAAPGRVRCERFGTSPEGRPMLALVASGPKGRRPSPTRRDRAVVLAIGGIHAGEVDGKDAGDLFLREWLLERKGRYPHATLVFVPVFNVDGHERFGPHQRPNQDGPRETGFRTTSANLNLNRDFAKADAPEMRALLGLVRRWDPDVVLDLHVTDGADFPADIAVVVRPVRQGPPALVDAGRSLRAALLAGLRADGFLALDFYPSFRVPDDPSSGVDDGDPSPRLSHGYFPLRGRVAVLVETHSWKPYARRVYATRAAIRSALSFASDGARTLRDATRVASTEALALPGTDVVLARRVDRTAGRTIPFESWGWTSVDSAALGEPVTRYDRSVRRTIDLPFSDVVVPVSSAVAPAGYLVPPAYARDLSERFTAHGIRFRRLPRPREASVEVFRATRVVPATSSAEGRHRLELDGAWQAERRTLPPGTLWVPVDQPLARLVVALLEPRAPDSFAAWGMFNAHFEQKEYLEPYVADAAAAAIFEDPAVAAAFATALEDPAFAASPQRRLDWIYRHHPAHDRRRDLYPVFRVGAADPLRRTMPRPSRRPPTRP